MRRPALGAATAILVPLMCGTQVSKVDRALALSTAPYFAFVGLGFMMTEVCLSQRFVSYLGHPTYALSVVLYVAAVGAGLGSGLVTRLPENLVRAPSYLNILGLAVVITLLLSSGLHTSLFAHMGHASFMVRVAFAAASILPVAALLGICLPSAMASLSVQRPDLVAWAWGVNGFFSVVGSCLGALSATTFGFAFTAEVAAALYAMAALLAPRTPSQALAVGPVPPVRRHGGTAGVSAVDALQERQ